MTSCSKLTCETSTFGYAVVGSDNRHIVFSYKLAGLMHKKNWHEEKYQALPLFSLCSEVLKVRRNEWDTRLWLRRRKRVLELIFFDSIEVCRVFLSYQKETVWHSP